MNISQCRQVKKLQPDSMGQIKVFSVFDASNGFWQVELDKESSFLTTFNTPFGRYRWERMPFGIKSAPKIWQRKIREHIEGLKGVEVQMIL